MRAYPIASLLAIIAAAPAAAEVVSAGEHGFHVRQTVQLVAPQPVTFESFGQVGAWWDNEHTYSGSAANMTMELRPGGCFCERLEGGGGIEHMRVAYIDPGKRLVLTGGLGPLLYEATSGVMDVKVERIGGGSRLTLDYKVAGFAAGGAAKIAPLVDQVLAEQVKRFRAHATARARAR